LATAKVGHALVQQRDADGLVRLPESAGSPPSERGQDSTRKREILEVASRVFAATGWRTPLQDLAAECGLLAGSLYYYFDSKEAIVAELIGRQLQDHRRIADEALAKSDSPEPGTSLAAVENLSLAIAASAVRNSAAVQLTFFEPPVPIDTPSPSTRQIREPIVAAMLRLLQAGSDAGSVRADVDLHVLADQLCQAMLRVGLAQMHSAGDLETVAVTIVDIFTNGLAADPISEEVLMGSAARRAVDRAVKSWSDRDALPRNERSAAVLDAARAEFGRRGYEVTTIRDIANAAGTGIGSVYRLFKSKEAILEAIMRSYADKVMSAWGAALYSDSNAVEKLDALAWQHINVMDHLRDEFKIQTTWIRQNPPDPDMGWSFLTLLRQLKNLVDEGIEAGEIRLHGPISEITARCVIDALCVPWSVVDDIGGDAALSLARNVVLNGFATRTA
jgi:AcrR family transcriptional regulator